MKTAVKRAGLGALTVFALVLLSICFVSESPDRLGWQARGYFHLGTNFLYTPAFIQAQMQTISNYLSDPSVNNELAGLAKVDEVNFRLIDITPVRSTRLFCIHYAGSESSTAESVTSNACLMLEALYTNTPIQGAIYLEGHPATIREPQAKRMW